MKENRLKIIVQKPAKEVFAFAINPKNTPNWIDWMVREETSQWPISIGTYYKNQNQKGKWSEYKVTEFEDGKIFLLTSTDGNLHVKYTVMPLGEHSSELEYFEWVDHGGLTDPFTQGTLNKLKQVIEA